jgi:hypothetical protein
MEYYNITRKQCNLYNEMVEKYCTLSDFDKMLDYWLYYFIDKNKNVKKFSFHSNSLNVPNDIKHLIQYVYHNFNIMSNMKEGVVEFHQHTVTNTYHYLDDINDMYSVCIIICNMDYCIDNLVIEIYKDKKITIPLYTGSIILLDHMTKYRITPCISKNDIGKLNYIVIKKYNI